MWFVWIGESIVLEITNSQTVVKMYFSAKNNVIKYLSQSSVMLIYVYIIRYTSANCPVIVCWRILLTNLHTSFLRNLFFNYTCIGIKTFIKKRLKITYKLYEIYLQNVIKKSLNYQRSVIIKTQIRWFFRIHGSMYISYPCITFHLCLVQTGY